MSFRTRKGNGAAARTARPTEGMEGLAAAMMANDTPPPAVPDAPAPRTTVKAPPQPTRRSPPKTGFVMAALQGPDPFHAIRVDIMRNGGGRVDTLPPPIDPNHRAPEKPFTYGRGRITAKPTADRSTDAGASAATHDATTANTPTTNDPACSQKDTRPMPQISKTTTATIFALQFPDDTAYIGRSTIPDSRMAQTRGFWPDCPDPVALVLATASLVSPEVMEAWRIKAREAGLRVRYSPQDGIYRKNAILFQDRPATPAVSERAAALASTLAWPAIDANSTRLPLIQRPGRGRAAQPTPTAKPTQPADESAKAAIDVAGESETTGAVDEARDEAQAATSDASHADADKFVIVPQGTDEGSRHDAAEIATTVAPTQAAPTESIESERTDEPLQSNREEAGVNHDPDAEHDEVAESARSGGIDSVVTPADTDEGTHDDQRGEDAGDGRPPNGEHAKVVAPTAAPERETEADTAGLAWPAPTTPATAPTFDVGIHARRILDEATLGLSYGSASLVATAMHRLASLRYGDQVASRPVDDIAMDDRQADAVLDEIESTEMGRAMLIAMTRSRTIEEMAHQLTTRAGRLTQPLHGKGQGQRRRTWLPEAIAALARRVSRGE